MAQTTRKSPTAAEALAQPVSFEFEGVTYSVPSTSEWSYDALEAFEEGRLTAFLRELLGDEQHAAWKATKPTVGKLGDLVGAMQKALGISGN